MEVKNKEIYWSKFAKKFEEKQSFVSGEKIIKITKKELSKEKNLGEALEIGCGTGLYTETLKNNAKYVTATDFSKEMVDSAKKLRGNFKNVKYEMADSMNLKFKGKSFDTVVMANLLHIVKDPEKVIKESNRVLKNKGKIIITHFAIDELSFINKIKMSLRFLKYFGKPPQGIKKITKKNVETMLEDEGFEIVQSKILGDEMKSVYFVGIKNKLK